MRARIGIGVAVLLAGLAAGCAGTSARAPVATQSAPLTVVTTSAAAQLGAWPFPRLHWRKGGNARLVPEAPPRSSAASDVLDLYSAGDVVWAATDNGISRSEDGGRVWHPVLSGYLMWSITRGPTGFVALGRHRSNSDRTVVATSRDGTRWTVVQARGQESPGYPGFGDTAVFDGRIGVAVARANAFPGGGPMLRTTDGGRTWITVPHFASAGGGLQMSASGTIVATGAGSGAGCVGAVYQSVDLGAMWTQLPASCRRMPLTAVQFVDADHAVAVGGWPANSGGGRVIETTSDGGRRWTVTNYVASSPARNPSVDGLATVDFVTPAIGYVLDGACEEGEDAPCGGELYRTLDGGRHLQRLPDPALSKGWLAVAPTTGGFVVAANPVGVATGGSTGSRLRLRIRPRELFTDVFTGAGRYVYWHNALGSYVMQPAGRGWRRHRPRSLRGADLEDNGLAIAAPGDVLDARRVSGPVVMRSSVNGGATWTEVRLTAKRDYRDVIVGYALGVGGGAAALTSDDEGGRDSGLTELYLSGSGGRRWVKVGRLPFRLDDDGAQPLSVAVSPSDLALLDPAGSLQITTNGGKTWRSDGVSAQDFCGVSAYRAELWLMCSVGADDQTWVLHSRDRGRTWTGYDIGAEVQSDVGSVAAIGSGRAVFSDAGALWRTSDGGATWRQSWPRLPGEAEQ